jgi:hypothetical protein
LVVIDPGAIDILVCTIKDVVEVVDKANCCGPVPNSLSPVNIGLIAGVAGEAG